MCIRFAEVLVVEPIIRCTHASSLWYQRQLHTAVTSGIRLLSTRCKARLHMVLPLVAAT
jgi:hypothetical protein